MKKDNLKEVLENKEKEILKEVLNKVLELELKQIEYNKDIELKDISGYEFQLKKIIGKTEENEEIEIYLKMIKKSKIKESIFCYWCSIYEEELEQIKETMKKDITLNKVLITNMDKKKYVQSLFLEIENNSTSILEKGTKVNFFNIEEYIEEKADEKNQYKELKKYFENNDESVMLIGVKINKEE